MKRISRRMAFNLILAISLLFLFYSFNNLKLNKNQLVFYYQNPIETKTVESIINTISRDTENVAYCFWEEKKDVKLFSNTQSYTVESLTMAVGHSRLLNNGELVSGRIPLSGETDVILLSESLAKRLYADSEPLGQNITLDDFEYLVVGVFKSEKDTATILNNLKTKVNYSFLELAFDNNKTSEQISTIVNLLGISKASFELDYTQVIDLRIALLTILAVLIITPILIVFYRKITNNRSGISKYIILFSFLLFLAVLIPKLLLKLPPDWVPNKWSDFSFWSNRMNYLKATLTKLFAVPGFAELANIKIRFTAFLSAYCVSFSLAFLGLFVNLSKGVQRNNI